MPRYTITVELSASEQWVLDRLIAEVHASPLPLENWTAEEELSTMIKLQLQQLQRSYEALQNVEAVRKMERQAQIAMGE